MVAQVNTDSSEQSSVWGMIAVPTGRSGTEAKRNDGIPHVH